MMNRDGDDQDDNEVGYGKPPKKHRFKAGQSGNPKGRPKSARNVAIELGAELDSKIIIRENGRETTVTKGAALAKSIVARALKGDMRSVAMLRSILPDRFGLLAEAAEDKALEHDEIEILERMIARRMARPAGEEKISGGDPAHDGRDEGPQR